MKRLWLTPVLLALFVISPAYAKNNNAGTGMTFRQAVHTKLKNYFHDYQDKEYFSGMALAIGFKYQPPQSYYMGTVSRSPNSKPVDETSLFQIGSISKSFTAAKILQLAAAGKLNLDDPIGKHLSGYDKWKHVTIKQLLNMTSGLPNYSAIAGWFHEEARNIGKRWSRKALINYAYPPGKLDPPLKTGFYYSNTAYLLAGEVIEQITQRSFKQALDQDILKPLRLEQTFYPVPDFSPENKSRLMHGYSYDPYDTSELLGQDMRLNNMTWAGAAGGIIATAPQIVQWVRDLFIRDDLLKDKQKKQLTSLVSAATGKPIEKTTPDDPNGFALGVAQTYKKDIGRFWTYEGKTLGFRAIYMYVPCNQVIIAATVNSAPDSGNDHMHSLLQDIYREILDRNPQYQCQS